MIEDALQLAVYFGESDRAGGRLLSDALLELFEEHRLHAAVLVRAAEGFGLTQTLRTDRFLTLSEDLPLFATTVDERARVEAVLPPVARLVTGGLVTVERARLLHQGLGLAEGLLRDEVKLTLYLGRDERIDGRPAYLAVVDHLRLHGVAGATVLLGVDGMAHRSRRRARFFSRNERVPLAIVSIGAAERLAAALPELDAQLVDPIATVEQVRVCKRDGLSLADPHRPADAGNCWQKLTVYAGEQARHRGRPLQVELIRQLREQGARGATSVRGIWGFSGAHRPHGDVLLRVRRRVPMVTTVVDSPDQSVRWFEIVDAITGEAGLVTSELVPRFLAVGRGERRGSLAPSVR